jgi:hypothetical protein
MNDRERQILEADGASCTWIFDHPSYVEWISKRSGLLGIRGKPGSGKSTLMKKIFQEFGRDEPSDLVNLRYFFHRRGVSLQQTRLGMFRTLLHQLLSQLPSAGSKFQKLCQEKKRWQSGSMKDWVWKLEELESVFTPALIAAAQGRNIRIFIDALDEAGDLEAQKIASYLYSINKKLAASRTSSICFSCRHFPVITAKDGYEIHVEDNNSAEIASFIAEDLQMRLDITEESEDEKSPLESLQTAVIERASRVFMWAALVIEKIIAPQYNNGEKLAAILQSLTQIPSDLADIYRHILTEVVNNKDRHHTMTVHSVLIKSVVKILSHLWKATHE